MPYGMLKNVAHFCIIMWCRRTMLMFVDVYFLLLAIYPYDRYPFINKINGSCSKYVLRYSVKFKNTRKKQNNKSKDLPTNVSSIN